jgi:RHS repeat-associated protein
LANHLGNVLTVISDKKTAICTGNTFNYFAAERISATDYSPFGAPLASRIWQSSEYRFGFTSIEKDDEIKGEGKIYATEFRELDTRIVNWWSIDPLFAMYPGYSPYNYTEGNPIVFNDRTGKGKTSTIINEKGNVVGGKIDGDNGVYMVKGLTRKKYKEEKNEEYKSSGTRIGTTASAYSFVDESGKFRGHLNFGSKAAYNKINQAIDLFKSRNPFPFGSKSAFLEYTAQGGNNGDYDIKSWGLDENYSAEKYAKNAYEASWGPQGLIFTNRDAGNFVAGRVAALMGIPWSAAESGFGAFNQFKNTLSTEELLGKAVINYLSKSVTEGECDNCLLYKEDVMSADLQKLGYFNK